jgi:nucleoside phosphorylase
MQNVQSEKSYIDVLIICALYDEFKALLDVQDGLLEPWSIERSGGWTVAHSKLKTDHGEMSIQATWQAFMGREQAIATTALLLKETNFGCIAMTGICAGRNGKVNLGDVIFADRLWSYDAGKTVVEEGAILFQGDELQFKVDSKILQRMQSLAISNEAWLDKRPKLPLEHQENWVLLELYESRIPSTNLLFKEKCPNWTEVIQRLIKRDWVNQSLLLTNDGLAKAKNLRLLYPHELPPVAEFKIEVAPIGTGAQVVEDKGIFPRLTYSMRKVLGIDMEASGLAALGDILDIPVIVAKGISDYGDPLKDDNYRYFAARASAECLIKLLRDAADLIKLQVHPIPEDNLDLQVAHSTNMPLDLISELANLYSDLESIRSFWERAGGKRSQVEQIQHPEDLWQRLWQKSLQGASVTPKAILTTALNGYPHNSVLNKYLLNL